MSHHTHGVLLLDKPMGMTSFQAIKTAQKKLNLKTVGHAGTLDPLATGLLICLVGEATRLSSYVMKGQKTYIAGIRLGQETDTLDSTGKVLETKSCEALTEDLIRKTALEIQGRIELPVPAFSAVKVKGRKLYEYARQGESVPEIIKPMFFEEIVVQSVPNKEELHVMIICQQGGYIRSWAHELGRRLGVGAHLISLRRTMSGSFSVDDAADIETVERSEGGQPNKGWIPMNQILTSWPRLKIFPDQESLLKNGQVPRPIRFQVESLLPQLFSEQKGIQLVDPKEERLFAIITPKTAHQAELGCVFAKQFS